MENIIKNIDAVYSVSSEGRFYKKGKEMKGCVNNTGYVVVSMYGKEYLLHRLVAFAFPEICGEWFEGAQVDHISTTKTDNRAENLRFVSCKTNNNNPLTKKHISEAKKGENNPFYGKHHTEETKKQLSKANGKALLQFSKDGKFVKEWRSAAEVERELGYDVSSICKCCNNKPHFRTAYGYIWRYKEAV